MFALSHLQDQIVAVLNVQVTSPENLLKLSMDIISLQHATKTRTSLGKCAFTTHRDTHKVGSRSGVKHHSIMLSG